MKKVVTRISDLHPCGPKGLDRIAQLREFEICDFPDQTDVHAEVLVRENISHPRDL